LNHAVKVVILPGMDGLGMALEEFVAALAPELEAVVVAYPNDRAMDFAAHLAFARANLPVDRPFILLGESYSGPVAISIASIPPSGLIGLVLCCTFARSPRPGLSWLRRFVSFVPARVPAAVPSWFLLGPFSNQRLRSALGAALAQITPDALRARLASVMDVDVTSLVAKIPVPILYLRATRDRIVPPRVSAELFRLNPRTRIVNVEAPHLLLQTAPAIAAGLLKSFLNEIRDER
jgi:pimeloyl-ACP methyl ester carboxylesterase